jgi:L,D-transpeptidase ErfK/SrfK
LAACATLPAAGSVFELHETDGTLIGSVERTFSRYEDTLYDLARRHSLGSEELVRANPKVDPWLPGEGTEVLLPGQRILPPGPREGIVVNLPEHRLYYFPKRRQGEPQVVITYPVSIGKMDWRTPLGKTRIVDKRKDPAWYPPASVRKEHAERGEPLPAVVPPGPDNPLGRHAMRLAFGNGSYLIHGTNKPIAVGMAVTHGCIRMYPEDIERLYALAPVGTPVYLINEPVKVAFVEGEVIVEAHPPVDAEGQVTEPDFESFSARLDAALGPTSAAVHWELAEQVLMRANGIPTVVGLEASPEPPESVEAAIADVLH